MFKADSDDFVIAMVMARRAGNAQAAQHRQASRDAATKARLTSALSASKRRVHALESELALEKGRRLQQQLLATRRRLFS
jgi:hypothetical protein|tara:strand:+ start:10207 stop:10446 length:240 start_codon:yes stop_codon:yes gene_type:complete